MPIVSAAAISYRTLRWVSRTPLGLPVVPEVYSRASGSPGLIAATRAVISPGSAASRSRPSAAKSAHVIYRSPAGHAARSRTMILVIPGSCSRIGCQRASSAAPSSTAIRASQSAATYAICSGASVAYNVTPRPPACTAPRSARTCSLRFGSINATRSPGASPSAANPAATSSTRCLRLQPGQGLPAVPGPGIAPASSEYAQASPEVSATCRNSSHSVRPAITPSISARRRTMSLLMVFLPFVARTARSSRRADGLSLREAVAGRLPLLPACRSSFPGRRWFSADPFRWDVALLADLPPSPARRDTPASCAPRIPGDGPGGVLKSEKFATTTMTWPEPSRPRCRAK